MLTSTDRNSYAASQKQNPFGYKRDERRHGFCRANAHRCRSVTPGDLTQLQMAGHCGSLTGIRMYIPECFAAKRTSPQPLR